MSNLKTDIRYLKGVGEKRAEKLSAAGIDTIGALLRFYPRGYEDFSHITPIFDCDFNQKVCVKAKIISEITEQYIRQNMTLYKFTAADSSGSMAVTIFNNKYLAAKLKTGREYLFLGKLSPLSYIPSMSSPEIRDVGSIGIEPIYRKVNGFGKKAIQALVKNALMCDLGDDPLPNDVKDENSLLDLRQALCNIHFPKSPEALKRAKERLVFEELFVLETSLMLLKRKNRRANSFVIKKDYTKEFLELLPFKLTSAQLTAIADSISDMSSSESMARLIEGDVGSGKTAVAAALMYTAAKNGFQSALMAPTEILAEQHFNSLCELFRDSGLKIALLKGSTKKSEKAKIKQGLLSGEYDIAVGTHALISLDVEFSSLGLVITDEQHRFGVEQRRALGEKGAKPHTLVMSATPIPGTLALVLYGDLDISVINEYPKGRQPIDTFLVNGKLRQRAYTYIKKHIAEGRQGFIVCPLIEENEGELISAESYYNNIRENEFKGYRLGLLHGRLKSKQKEEVMSAFVRGEIDLLVCTTVIEVGIDVPNAAIMVIENAERFGLSALHQLRGRIGRGKHKSSCILISDSTSDKTENRLKVLVNNRDGFKIADEDLKLRGPGDFLGSRQHGLPPMKIADIFSDAKTLSLTVESVKALLAKDPYLKAENNKALRQEVIDFYNKINQNQ